MNLKFGLAAASAAMLFSPSTAIAQDQASDTNVIVVEAKRSGAPMWTIDTPSGTVVLVGEIAAIPQSTPWYPDRLEDATKQASRVIIPALPKVSPGDIFRMIFAGGKITKLPDGSVASDYLDPSQRARLAALETTYDVDYDRRSFLMSAFDLLARRLDFDDETSKSPTDIVRKTAKRADVPILRPERFRGEDLLDNLAEAEPESHIACLEAAMTATELGPSIIEQRGEDWRSFDIAAVMGNPLEVALGKCWPWADDDLGNDIRDQWTDMISQAAQDRGVTLAVVPLRVLAEEDGVLDQLEARGLPVSGPDWR